MFSVVTTRFDDYTWSENKNFRDKNKLNGCIYGSPQPMSPKIIQDAYVFVIEMNNSINQIEGIGLIKNTIRLDKYFRVYETGNFNRYVFRGKHHILRDDLLKINDQLVIILDQILFKGKTHLKRGAGFTQIPEKLLNHEKCKSINLNIRHTIKDIFLRFFETDIADINTNKNEDNLAEKKELQRGHLLIEE
jgi:hypothetical protein